MVDTLAETWVEIPEKYTVGNSYVIAKIKYLTMPFVKPVLLSIVILHIIISMGLNFSNRE